MKTSFAFLLLAVLPFTITSQNLIADPGFEIMQKHPTRQDNGIRCTSDWINAIITMGDYYNSAAKREFLGVGVPKNIFGFQQPHSGFGYAGICIEKDMVEYVETRLKTPLVKGKKYLIEVYISKAEHRSGHVDEFGVLFTSKLEWNYPRSGVPVKPPVDFVNEGGYKDSKEWTKLSATYTAEGFETVFIFGHFTYGTPLKGKAHYYIDDVSVTPVKDETIISAKDEKVKAPESRTDSILKAFSPKMGEAVTLKNIYFATNKAELLSTSFSELDRLVQYLNTNMNTTIEISGHTDNTGDEKQNQLLSEARAKAVADYLTSKFIDSKRIKYIGHGSAKPIATNDTDDDRQLNRRVEVILNKK